MENATLTEITKEEFTNRHLLGDKNMHVDVLTDFASFEVVCYSCGEHDFAEIAFPSGEKYMTVPHEYSPELLAKARALFPELTSFTFFTYEKQSEKPEGMSLNYLFRFPVESGAAPRADANVSLQRITDENFDVLERYCEKYQADWPERHPAKLTNIYQKSRSAVEKTSMNVDIFIAFAEDCEVGFIIADTYERYDFVAVGQLSVEPEFQEKGCGHSALAEITRQILGEGKLPFYMLVDFDNTASIKCCEKAGYVFASGRLTVDIGAQ